MTQPVIQKYRIMTADAIEGLRLIEEGSVDMCVTSPPYYGLRDYGTEGQIGLETTPEEYVEKLVAIFREVRRVLRNDGTLWLNLGDSYATKSGRQAPRNTRNRCGHTEKRVPRGLKYKDLIGIPWMVAFALRADGWYLRQDIIWNKPNCMPESVRDRCTKSHEYIFMLSKSQHYYFDAEAIREPVAASTVKRLAQDVEHQAGSFRQPGKTNGPMKAVGNGKTRNKRDVWTIGTKPFKGAHFAAFPPELIRPCIRAGSRPGGIVIDPFLGSGTTGIVSAEENRNFIGIDINPSYTELAKRRIFGGDINGQNNPRDQTPEL